jgi:hypothetical protein
MNIVRGCISVYQLLRALPLAANSSAAALYAASHARHRAPAICGNGSIHDSAQHWLPHAYIRLFAAPLNIYRATRALATCYNVVSTRGGRLADGVT